MNRVFFLFFFFLSLHVFSQEKVIMKKFSDGSPHVIYYYEFVAWKRSLVKKEIYYSNGKMEYTGEMKNGKEHGYWKYFYENGSPKAEEYWQRGKEEGVWKEYDESGKLIKESEYKAGKLIKSKTY